MANVQTVTPSVILLKYELKQHAQCTFSLKTLPGSRRTALSKKPVCSCVLIVKWKLTHSVFVKPGAKVSVWCTDGGVYQGLYCDLDLDGAISPLMEYTNATFNSVWTLWKFGFVLLCSESEDKNDIPALGDYRIMCNTFNILLTPFQIIYLCYNSCS